MPIRRKDHTRNDAREYEGCHASGYASCKIKHKRKAISPIGVDLKDASNESYCPNSKDCGPNVNRVLKTPYLCSKESFSGIVIS
jgi:hypothetical protein